MADETTSTRILADPQDPLPEASWLWRRVFTFLALGLAFLLLFGLATAVNRIVGNVVGRIDSMDARNVAQITVVALQTLMQMFKLMFYLAVLSITYYMVAPSAEQIVKVIQTAGLLRSGVQFASRAVADTGDRREETASTIGKPPQPAVPPPGAPQAAPETPAPSTGLPDAPWAASPPPPDKGFQR